MKNYSCQEQIDLGTAIKTAQAWYEEGQALVELGRWQEAAESYDEALKYCATDPAVLTARSWALFVLGELDRALADVESAIINDPQLEWARRVHSIVLFRLGRHTDALREAALAVELAPQRKESLQNLFTMQRALGFMADAWTTAHRLGDVAPQDAETYITLGAIQLDYQQWSDAEAEFRAALTLNPNAPRALEGLGVALHHQGRTVPAIHSLSRAIELGTESSTINANLMRARERYFAVNSAFAVLATLAAFLVAGLLTSSASDSDRAALLLGGAGSVIIAVFMTHRWMKARRLPMVARGIFQTTSRERRTRIFRLLIGPATVLLLLLLATAVAILIIDYSRDAVVVTVVLGVLAAGCGCMWLVRRIGLN